MNTLSLPQEVLKGEIGEILRFEEPPEESHNEDGDQDDTKKRLTPEQKIIRQVYAEGKYFIMPSFFKTLMYLQKLGRDFAVVFRTFGHDLENVIWEFNKFCSGQHPCYNGKNGMPLVKFDGSRGTKDLRINDRYQQGLFYRSGEDVGHTQLVTGTIKRVIFEFNLFRLRKVNQLELSMLRS